LTIQRTLSRATPEGMVTQIILADLRRGGAIANGFSNTYGLRRDVH
jgi:hypothetical protein